MTPGPATDCDSPMDHAAALRRTEGDVELLADMVRIFLDDCPRLLANVRTAVASGTPTQIAHAAHELKGCLGNFAAHRGFAAAETLEMLGRCGATTGARAAAERLELELQRLTPVMERLITRDA
jgi:two-component system sensor histidine kinase/response regulator